VSDLSLKHTYLSRVKIISVVGLLFPYGSGILFGFLSHNNQIIEIKPLIILIVTLCLFCVCPCFVLYYLIHAKATAKKMGWPMTKREWDHLNGPIILIPFLIVFALVTVVLVTVGAP
jgi:uncharacterized membrane protein YcgQ (UPF0703/DUF1980 family)